LVVGCWLLVVGCWLLVVGNLALLNFIEQKIYTLISIFSILT